VERHAALPGIQTFGLGIGGFGGDPPGEGDKVRYGKLPVVAHNQLLFRDLHPQALHQILVGLGFAVTVFPAANLLFTPLVPRSVLIVALTFIHSGYGRIFRWMHGIVNLLILYPHHAVRYLFPLAHLCGIHPGGQRNHDLSAFGQFQQVRQQQRCKSPCTGQPVFGIYPYHTAPKPCIKLDLFGDTGGQCLAWQIPEDLVDTHIEDPDI